MSDDTIHSPSPATNDKPAESGAEKIGHQTIAPSQPTPTSQPAPAEPVNAEQRNSGPLSPETLNIDQQPNAAESPFPTTRLDGDGFPAAYQTNRSGKRPAGRPSLVMAKEQLMAAIAEVTDKLGHVPSHAELMRSGKVSGRHIVKHFGTYTRALRACDLERVSGGNKLPLEKLFLDWARVVREVKRIPSKADYETMGKHSITPLRARFGSWGQVPRYLRRYMEEQGLTEEWKDVMALIRAYEQGQDGMEMPPTPECEQQKPRVMTDRPVYGPLIRPCPMIHGPINENGVLYLFGTVSDRLGFVVTLIQGAFPDCYAMRLVDVDRWQPVRIEFEYESRNFLRHMHDPSGCDIIVCWKHNWPECPLEVIELSKIVGEGSR